ncbi:hypothetical protein N0Y54_30425 [Nostoc punctiforme UO1]
MSASYMRSPSLPLPQPPLDSLRLPAWNNCEHYFTLLVNGF